jgi:FkbM family methyltransferase
MRANALTLDFEANKSAMATLREIFGAREYSDWFPFYENARIVDVGAHFGFFSLFAERNSGPAARIVAVEPATANFQVLNANLRESGARKITALHRAVGGSNGTVQLALGASVNNSIVPATQEQDGSQRSESVTCVTLEALLEQSGLDGVDFLKMDCEGAEYEIFATTPRPVLDRITTVSMEFHDLKTPQYNANWLASKLFASGFEIKKFEYSPTGIGKNYGKLIASKLLGARIS